MFIYSLRSLLRSRFLGCHATLCMTSQERAAKETTPYVTRFTNNYVCSGLHVIVCKMNYYIVKTVNNISNCTVKDPGLLCFKHNYSQNCCSTTKQAEQERGISFSYMLDKKVKVSKILTCCYGNCYH